MAAPRLHKSKHSSASIFARSGPTAPDAARCTVEELRIALAHGAWAMEGVRCMRAIVDEDVVEATGWLPPSEREGAGVTKLAGGEQDVAETTGWAPPDGEEQGWEEEEGGWDSTLQPPEPAVVRPPTPVKTYGERESGGPMVFWPRRLPLDHVGTSPDVPTIGGPAAPVGVAPAPAPRAFAGWGEDGRELSCAFLPARVCRPVPLRPADAPAMPSPVAPSLSRVSVHRVRACTTDELGDDDMRSIRDFVRGAGWRGMFSDWAGMARGYWNRFMSAASRPLELPSLARQYTTARAVHEPPD